jgi:prevent-host-death family protein
MAATGFLPYSRRQLSGAEYREVHTEDVLSSGRSSGTVFWSKQQRGRRLMRVKFSEDVVPLTDLKVNPGRVIKHVTEVHRPLLLTSRGRGVAVVQSISDYELAEEERAFMRAVVAGLADLDAGREVSLAEARNRLGLP